MDAGTLAQALIRCPSVTPEDAGALDVLAEALEALGFTCHHLVFGENQPEGPVRNLYARRGTGSPHLCFAGHTDVVPVGQGWTHEPFEAGLHKGKLYGRGATDMKGAIAAWVQAVAAFLDRHPDHRGSLSFLITGDEEGPATFGTVKVVDWLRDRDEAPDLCLVGEPTSQQVCGDMVKIGRRGSLNGVLTIRGTQGHVAYPHLADNPIPRAMDALSRLSRWVLDEGTEHFPPSNLEITSVDVGNPTTNLIPGSVQARFNIRFNDLHTGESLTKKLHQLIQCSGIDCGLEVRVSGEAFLTPPGAFSETVVAAIKAVTGQEPVLSTTGGTSDARFIKDLCPVIECGLPNASMHKADEHVRLEDLATLAAIYTGIIRRVMGVA